MVATFVRRHRSYRKFSERIQERSRLKAVNYGSNNLQTKVPQPEPPCFAQMNRPVARIAQLAPGCMVQAGMQVQAG